MDRKLLLAASILGLLSILLGAFGAHGLKTLISADAVQTFETGVRYQMYHALMLLFVGGSKKVAPKFKTAIFYLVLVGIVCFSGSIYGLSTNPLSAFDFKTIAFITPIGGLLLIIAWLLIFVNFIKYKS